jgi:Ca2+-binding RTX toxin-like protein
VENLIGSKFDDKLTGTDSNNVMTGGKGADVLKGLGGSDTVSYAGSGKSVQIDLNKTAQISTGDAKGDVISGFENIIGSRFDDALTGTNGKNIFIGGRGGDSIKGGGGTDTVSYASSSEEVSVDLRLTTAQISGGDARDDMLSSIENLTGSKFSDILRGDGGANTLSGGAETDFISGYGGADILIGGAGSDRFYFNAGDGKDTIRDFVAGTSFEDVVVFDIDPATFGTFAQVMAAASQVGANTVFTFDADTTLTLLNVQKSAIAEADIQFPFF